MRRVTAMGAMQCGHRAALSRPTRSSLCCSAARCVDVWNVVIRTNASHFEWLAVDHHDGADHLDGIGSGRQTGGGGGGGQRQSDHGQRGQQQQLDWGRPPRAPREGEWEHGELEGGEDDDDEAGCVDAAASDWERMGSEGSESQWASARGRMRMHSGRIGDDGGECSRVDCVQLRPGCCRRWDGRVRTSRRGSLVSQRASAFGWPLGDQRPIGRVKKEPRPL